MTIPNIININLIIFILLLLVLVLIFFYFETEGRVIKNESSQTFLKVTPIDPNSDGGKNRSWYKIILLGIAVSIIIIILAFYYKDPVQAQQMVESIANYILDKFKTVENDDSVWGELTEKIIAAMYLSEIEGAFVKRVIKLFLQKLRIEALKANFKYTNDEFNELKNRKEQGEFNELKNRKEQELAEFDSDDVY